LALSVGVGLGVLSEMLEAEVDEVVGPNGEHNPDRTAVRHGHETGEVTLGGRRVAVERPRVRTADGSEEVPRPPIRHCRLGARRRSQRNWIKHSQRGGRPTHNEPRVD
jgi:hypothetical protein